MVKETAKMAQMNHQHALSDTVVEECTSVLMGIVQHLRLSVMVWMIVEIEAMKRIVTYHVLIWNSSANPMAAVC